ncbi:MAG: MtrB/PioB family outer membrane beta-barrel protein [Gammaproteobacteria bacterium]|nr:MtrB/PioB family outer membrane beta-barrel protein [Gammaproteobacteria bacterium]
MKDVFNQGTEDQYPDNETSRTSIKLWANYKYNKKLSYKLAFWYEDYDADNWAIDDVPAYTANSGALFLDGDSPDYDVTVITLSATYRF